MRLSPADHMFYGEEGYPVEFIFFYKEKLNLARLQKSLRRALRAFSPLKKSFIIKGETAFLEGQETIEIEFLNKENSLLPLIDDRKSLAKHHCPVESIPSEKLMRA